jgi:hypothetical protein
VRPPSEPIPDYPVDRPVANKAPTTPSTLAAPEAIIPPFGAVSLLLASKGCVRVWWGMGWWRTQTNPLSATATNVQSIWANAGLPLPLLARVAATTDVGTTLASCGQGQAGLSRRPLRGGHPMKGAARPALSPTDPNAPASKCGDTRMTMPVVRQEWLSCCSVLAAGCLSARSPWVSTEGSCLG